MTRQSQAVVLFSATAFASALVPFWLYKPAFANGTVSTIVWFILPVMAAVWAGLIANFFVHGKSKRFGAWRGAVAGVLVLTLSAVLATVPAMGTENYAKGAGAIIALALIIFGWLAACVGALAGWLCQRLLLAER